MKIVIYGLNGKMGRTLLETAADFPSIDVRGGVDRAEGKVGGAPVYADLSSVREKFDCIIDFSRPSALPSILKYADKRGVKLVLCATGYGADAEDAIALAARKTAIFKSSNTCAGVEALRVLAASAAKMLTGYDIEIIEKHHREKADAPSGTAAAILAAVNAALSDKKTPVYGRSPFCGRRGNDEIGVHAVRGGTITGEHEIIFAGEDEVISIKHTALSKKVFARGALNAALFLADKPAGLYSVSDMLR